MEKLSKQPLVEVVFELHWESKEDYFDQGYKLIIGAFYEHIRDEFPAFDPLPTASIPEDVIPPDSGIVQYRFWSKGRDWPVVQLGPGILTVNMNKYYENWTTFKPIIEKVIGKFFSSYPNKEGLVVKKLILKYIDFFQFDFSKSNVLDYLKNKLHINLIVDLGEEPLKANISEVPVNIDLKLENQIKEPEGVIGFRIFRAFIEGNDGLVMESYVMSSNFSQSNLSKDSISLWLEQAHNMTDLIFSNLIRGELMEELR